MIQILPQSQKIRNFHFSNVKCRVNIPIKNNCHCETELFPIIFQYPIYEYTNYTLPLFANWFQRQNMDQHPNPSVQQEAGTSEREKQLTAENAALRAENAANRAEIAALQRQLALLQV